MFHWRIKGHEIVLTDEEEAELVRQLADSTPYKDRAPYFYYTTSGSARRMFENLIFAYLKKLFHDDYDIFCQKYYHRDVEGEDAQGMLTTLLNGYGRCTKLATYGRYHAQRFSEWIGIIDNRPRSDSPIEYVFDSKCYVVTLFAKRFFSFMPYKPFGYLSFPCADIERVKGNVESFDLYTVNSLIQFRQDFVNIKIL